MIVFSFIVFFLMLYKLLLPRNQAILLFYSLYLVYFIVLDTGYLGFDVISISTQIYFCIIFSFFFMGALVGKYFVRKTNYFNTEFNYSIIRILFKLYFLLSVAYFAFNYDRFFDLSNLIEMRTNDVNERSYAVIIVENSLYALAINFYLYYRYTKERKYLIPMVISVLICGAGLSRAPILIFILYMIGFSLYYEKNFKFSRNIIYVGWIISLFLIIGAVRGSFDFDNDLLLQTFDKTMNYILAGIPAFDVWYNLTNNDSEFYFNAIPFFAKLLNFLQFDIVPNQYKYEIVWVGSFGTNIYSAHREFVSDLGVLGTAFFFLAIGFFVVRLKACSETPFIALLYSTIVSLLFFSPIYPITMYIFPFLAVVYGRLFLLRTNSV